jgi:hypothetical protein
MASRLRSVDEAPDAREGLRRLFAAFEALTLERPDFPALFVREAVSRGIEPAVVPHMLQIIDITRRLAERGRREGSFREVDPLLFHFGFVGALAFFFATEPARRRAAPHLPFRMPTTEAFVRHLEEMTFRGLAPGTSPVAKTRSKTNKRKKGARS